MLWRILCLGWLLSVSLHGIAGPATPVTLVIWPFDAMATGASASAEDTSLVRDVLPDLLASDLAASPRVQLVERQHLLEILNEQKLGASDLADEATRLRLGRLSGAQFMVFGQHVRLGPVWRLDSRLVEVETARVVTSFTESGQGADYAATSRRIAGHLLAAFAVAPDTPVPAASQPQSSTK